MVAGFYWLIPGQLAGCARPGASAGHTEAGDPREAIDALDRDLAWLRRQGIGAVLSLTETPLLEEVVTRHGLIVLHEPVPDLQPPAPDQLVRALSFIDRQRMEGRAVAVHCLVGQGRTGTVLAAYRIRAGAGVEEALRELRTICPGAIGSPAQEQALKRFATRREWLV